MTTTTMKTILTTTILFLLSFTSLHAEINCSQETVCIETQEGKNEMLFYAINKKEYTTAITVDVKAKGMKPTVRLPNSFIVKGKERKFIFALKYDKKAGVYNYSYTYGWAKGDPSAVHNTQYVYALPYSNKKTFKVTQSCNGAVSHNGHSQYAIDFNMPMNTIIYAAREGIVVDLKGDSSEGGYSKKFMDKANYILIEHSDGTLGEYVHLKLNGVAVALGQRIKKGQPIGYSGNTGYSSNPHLHFAVKSVDKKGNVISIPSPFKTSKGTLTCPKKNTLLSY